MNNQYTLNITERKKETEANLKHGKHKILANEK